VASNKAGGSVVSDGRTLREGAGSARATDPEARRAKAARERILRA
jgi:hypothetical protein